jgi:hypothetical protein
MADRKKKHGKHGEPASLSSSGAYPAPSALLEYEALFHAIDGFIRANTNFESSIPTNEAIDAIGRCTDLKSVFSTPLQRQLFSMDTALRWVLFLSVAPERAVTEGDEPFDPAESFSAQEALALISNVYDIGVQETVWDHFEVDEDEEDDESEEVD